MASGRAVTLGLALVVVLACGAAAAYGATRTAVAGASVPPPTGSGAPVAPVPDEFGAGVDVRRDGEAGLWLSWSLIERSSGRWTGSSNAATERTNAESAIKAWIAADVLRTAHDARRPVTATERELIRRAVRSSDDDATETLYRSLGGDAVLTHLRATCGVAVATERRGYWALTQVTAVDAARTLDCVLRLAPRWAGGADLIGDLRAVDESGRSGIATLLPGARVAEKNGWTYHSSTGWNVNCVVAWDDYVLSVLTRYPGDRSEQYGWAVCQDVARDVLRATRL